MYEYFQLLWGRRWICLEVPRVQVNHRTDNYSIQEPSMQSELNNMSHTHLRLKEWGKNCVSGTQILPDLLHRNWYHEDYPASLWLCCLSDQNPLTRTSDLQAPKQSRIQEKQKTGWQSWLVSFQGNTLTQSFDGNIFVLTNAINVISCLFKVWTDVWRLLPMAEPRGGW